MKKIILSTFIAGAFLLTSCVNTQPEAMAFEKVIGDSLKTTYTIAKLKEDFLKKTDMYSDTNSFKDPSKILDLYTADLIESNQDVVISGYVTSTDLEGASYKSFVMQEDIKGGQAIRISVNASGASSLYPFGQRVWVRCNGLYIGNYGQMPQIGSKEVNKTKFKFVKSQNAFVYRIEPDAMAETIAKNHIYVYGMPDGTKIKPMVMTLAEIKASKYDTLVYKLVTVKNAYFTGFDGDNKPLDGANLIFAPSTATCPTCPPIGYPQARMISDGTATLPISTSEFTRFAKQPIPPSTYRGDITFIVGWYKGSASAGGEWQLSLRTLGDLGPGFENYLKQVNYK